MKPEIFKAYDIRGIYPQDINKEDAFKIAQAFAKVLKPKTVVLGKDIRAASDELHKSAKEGLIKAGVKVIDIGEISTDMMYFATANYGYDSGIIMTASHNPREWAGMKMVEKDSFPIFSENRLPEIQELAMDENFSIDVEGGSEEKKDIWDDYIKKIKSFVNFDALKPLKVVINANFGLGGITIKKIFKDSPIEWVELNCEPDGTFPKGRPDPFVPENRKETIEKVKETGADLGIAWDADADRCFFYDENGNDIEGSFTSAFLAKIVLEKTEKENEKIITDPRIVWPVVDTTRENGGFPIMANVGHAYFKEKMKTVNGVAGFEGSGHYYFRDFFSCDCGMVPAALIISYLCENGVKLSEALEFLTSKYFLSGEINFEAENKDEIIQNLKGKYKDAKQDELDGISIEYDDWRINVRKSNTEPLLRLNMEARNENVLKEKLEEVSQLIKSLSK